MTTYETREAIAKLAEMDPELSEFLKAGGKPFGLDSDSVEDSTVFLNGPPAVEPPTTAKDAPLDIPMRDGRLSRARVYRSAKPAAGPRPLVVYIFGGGWLFGDPAQVAMQAKAIAEATGAIVVSPNYRLAPAHVFPAGPEDIWDALAWLAQPANAAALGADVHAGLAIGGVSAGANMAAVTAQRCLSERAPGSAPLTGLALVVPFVLEPEIVPARYKDFYFSREQNADALTTGEKSMRFTRKLVQFDVTSPQFSPFNAPNPHVGMPPTYVQAAGLDPLRDDALIYERVLREHGVKTRLDVYPGVPHAHNFVFPNLKSSHKAHVDLVKGVAWLLGQDVGDEEADKAVQTAIADSPGAFGVPTAD
ncbi:lipase/esterase [Auricularia subglabra TFB-10046 SS5]|nr:lipase/esterase [Auricularia subglabra TFB-10046 SS5]